MAFPVDERVSCVVMRNNPLISGESHFTASFGGSWFRNFNCQLFKMSWTKESADAGIAGLREWEAARGVLGGEVDVDAPDVPDVEFIKVVSNSNNII